MKKAYITFIAALLAISMSGQQLAKGFVFSDDNNSGIKDTNEKGIAKVSVSNGREVVLTDDKGYYELTVGNDNIIFVIKPYGYDLPADYQRLQVNHIHKV